MALNTATYDQILQRWCSYTGIEYADLLSNEAELFKQFGQARLRKIWFEADWPETVNLSEETLVDQKFTAGTSIAYILGIYDKDPLLTTSEAIKTYEPRRVQDSVYVYGSNVPAVVYVLYKERVDEFDSSADTVPYRFAEYIAQGAYADWLNTEDDPRAPQAEAKAQALLLDELEIYERDEQGRRWGTQMASYSPASY